MWAIARVHLGLTNREFFCMSFRSLQLLLDCYIGQEHREDYRAGLIAAMVCNASLGGSKKLWQPEDFFPHLKQGPQRQSDERIAMGFEVVLKRLAAKAKQEKKR